MKTSHRWLCNFFQREDCFESTYNKFSLGNYLAPIKLTVIDKTCWVILGVDRAYEYMVFWNKMQGSKLTLSKETFIEDMELINIVKKRVQISKQNKKHIRELCFKLNSKYIQKAIKSHYKIDKLKLSWAIEDQALFNKLSSAYHKDEHVYKTIEKFL